MKLPPNRSSSHSILLKALAAIFCAIVLSFAPNPAFAQHSGGSGGSHGGGSSAGSHSGGGGHGGPAAGSTNSSGGGSAGRMHMGGATHSGAAVAAAPNPPYSGSHIWVGSSPGSPMSSAPIERFAAGNNIWQDPPSARTGPVVNSAPSVKTSAAGQKNSMTAAARPFVIPAGYRGPLVGSTAPKMPPLIAASSTRGPLLGTTQTPQPPRIFIPRPRHRFFGNDFFFIDGGCIGGFFPGFCGSALWWGSGYAWGPGCDPVLGCAGYGYPNYVTGVSDDMQVQSDGAPPQEYGPLRWQDSPALDSGVEPRDLQAPAKSAATIYLKDGSSYGVTDYWLTGGDLHYITNYGGENSIPAERLDLQRTVDENAAGGVSFILSNQPAPHE
jgi:hypothetical protein